MYFVPYLTEKLNHERSLDLSFRGDKLRYHCDSPNFLIPRFTTGFFRSSGIGFTTGFT